MKRRRRRSSPVMRRAEPSPNGNLTLSPRTSGIAEAAASYH